MVEIEVGGVALFFLKGNLLLSPVWGSLGPLCPKQLTQCEVTLSRVLEQILFPSHIFLQDFTFLQ